MTREFTDGQNFLLSLDGAYIDLNTVSSGRMCDSYFLLVMLYYLE